MKKIKSISLNKTRCFDIYTNTIDKELNSALDDMYKEIYTNIKCKYPTYTKKYLCEERIKKFYLKIKKEKSKIMNYIDLNIPKNSKLHKDTNVLRMTNPDINQYIPFKNMTKDEKLIIEARQKEIIDTFEENNKLCKYCIHCDDCRTYQRKKDIDSFYENNFPFFNDIKEEYDDINKYANMVNPYHNGIIVYCTGFITNCKRLKVYHPYKTSIIKRIFNFKIIHNKKESL